METQQSVEGQVRTYCEALTEKTKAYYEKAYKNLTPPVFKYTKGPKFFRVYEEQNGRATSVHCFVSRETAEVFKAAGWKAPAKGARFRSPAEALQAVPERVGIGYLYLS